MSTGRSRVTGAAQGTNPLQRCSSARGTAQRLPHGQHGARVRANGLCSCLLRELDVGETQHRSRSPHGSSSHFDSAAAGARCHRSHLQHPPAAHHSRGEGSPVAPRATLLPVGPGRCHFQPCGTSRTGTETHGLARHGLQLGQSPQPR